MKKNVKTMILLLLSYIILMSFSYVSGLYGNKNNSSGILCLIIYIIISYIIINYLKTTKNRKKTITSILISLIISCALVYGYNLEAKDDKRIAVYDSVCDSTFDADDYVNSKLVKGVREGDDAYIYSKVAFAILDKI